MRSAHFRIERTSRRQQTGPPPKKPEDKADALLFQTMMKRNCFFYNNAHTHMNNNGAKFMCSFVNIQLFYISAIRDETINDLAMKSNDRFF